jgi:hypothetical protein
MARVDAVQSSEEEELYSWARQARRSLDKIGTKKVGVRGEESEDDDKTDQQQHHHPPYPKGTKGEGVLEALGEAVALDLAAGRWGKHVLERARGTDGEREAGRCGNLRNQTSQ